MPTPITYTPANNDPIREYNVPQVLTGGCVRVIDGVEVVIFEQKINRNCRDAQVILSCATRPDLKKLYDDHNAAAAAEYEASKPKYGIGYCDDCQSYCHGDCKSK